MFKIKIQNQPRHPLTCDFFFLRSHLTCPGIEGCGRTGRGERGGRGAIVGTLLQWCRGGGGLSRVNIIPPQNCNKAVPGSFELEMR